MANGYSLGVLQFQKEVSKDATPQYKVEPYGFLGSLYVSHSRGAIKNDSYDGHFKTVKIKSKKRFTTDDVSPEASCDTVLQQTYAEETVDVSNFCQLAIHVEDEVIAAFDSYASSKTSTGSLSLMYEHMDSVATAASALLSYVNQDLMTLAVAALGVNRRTASAAAATINIPLNTTNEPLGDGINQVLGDFKLNTMMGKPIVTGQGLFYNWLAAQAAKSGVNQSGIDSRLQTAGFDFWYDPYVTTAMTSANQIMVHEKNSIQIVEYLKYQGWKAGAKPGASSFGTLTLPMQIGDQLVPVFFDYQLKYNDCEQEFTIGYGGSTTTLEKGYNLIISKTYGLYTLPATAYDAADVLTGNRGSLRYLITNT